MSLSLCFIGAGNLATQLSKALQIQGFFISQVYSRTEKSAKELADILSTRYTTSVNEIDAEADVYIAALTDSAVESVLSQIEFHNKLVVHCSGSLPLSILEKHSANVGVLYPLQTFSKARHVDFKTIPVFVESNNSESEKVLMEIARQVSNSVAMLNSEKRKMLHISAVFACNFVNHLYSISSEILNENNISFEVLKPLILETAQKVQEIDPGKAQTGPAVRYDINVISSHLERLSGFKNYQELYSSISKSIFEHHKKENNGIL